MSFDLQEKYYAQNEEQKFLEQAFFFLLAELTKGAHFTGELLDAGVVRGDYLWLVLWLRSRLLNMEVSI